jgi:hypothetical protein
MNPRELVDHIRSGPAEIVFDKPLRFRRRTRSNPCDFNEFLQALHSSEKIRSVGCRSHLVLGITEDEWVLLVKTIGFIRDIQNLKFTFMPSRDFHPLQAIADAVRNARSLVDLNIAVGSFPREQSGMIALASAIQEHTTLLHFTWLDIFCSQLDSAQITTFDLLLRVLPACTHLREVLIMTIYASSDAVKNLLQIQAATELHLVLATDQWLAIADEIRQGRCNVQRLTLTDFSMSDSETTWVRTKAVKAVARAIQLDCNLDHLTLRMDYGLTDEAGMALAEALTINTTLRKLDLCTSHSLGQKAYEALSAMLRVNTSLVLNFKTAGADGRPCDRCESRDQLRIEMGLNNVGRGVLLTSGQTTRKDWVDALCELNSHTVDDSPAIQVSCLYSLLLLHPFVCMS